MNKKVSIIATIFMLLIALVSPFAFNSYTVHADNNLTILLSASHNETDESCIDVYASLRENSGINAAILELEYDENAFEFIGFERGSALNKLDLTTTNVDTEQGYSIKPFKFNWWNQELEDDYSTGNLLVMHFKMKDDAENGNYVIGFTYNEGDITYNGTTIKRPSINTVNIKINDHVADITNNVRNIIIKTIIIVLICLGGLVALAAIVYVCLQLTRKKKKSWVKVR